MACDVQTLAEAAKCEICEDGNELQGIVQLLWCRIAAGGAGTREMLGDPVANQVLGDPIANEVFGVP